MSPPLDFSLLLFLPSTTIISSSLLLLFLLLSFLLLSPGRPAWSLSRSSSIPGPTGFLFAFSSPSAHRSLSELSAKLRAASLMSFSVGLTRFVVSSSPRTAKDILNSPAFADRPVKESAYGLLFHRAMGFAPFGEYWRNLRRISSTHLFSPKRISSFGAHRVDIGMGMMEEVRSQGVVEVRRVMHHASLNNVMGSVFGRRYDFGSGEGRELEGMVREGYELLGKFNWGDHLPMFVGWLDLQGVRRRCRGLVGRVNVFVRSIIDEHRKERRGKQGVDVGDFVDVLLGLEEEEKLSDSDMVAVLWVSSSLLASSFVFLSYIVYDMT